MLVDVVAFFGQNVFTDLQAAPGSVHPILIVDAIKYLYTFRNQASTSRVEAEYHADRTAHEGAARLGSAIACPTSQLGQLCHLLLRRDYDRTDPLPQGQQPGSVSGPWLPADEAHVRFTQADVQPFAENVLLALFANIEKGGTPEKIAENDYLMKCEQGVPAKF